MGLYHFQPMKVDEFRDLIGKAQGGDIAARNMLIEHNIGLVRRIANIYHFKHEARHSEYSDLVQDGVLGLIRAIQKFDVERDVEFSTYATPWIRSFILDAKRQRASLIHVPNYMKFMIDEMDEGRETEKTKRRRLAKRHVNHARQIMQGVVSLDASEYEHSCEDTIEFPEEDRKIMVQMIGALNKKEYMAVTRHYGIEGECREPAKVLAQEWGVSKTTVRAIRRQAIKKMRSIYDKM